MIVTFPDGSRIRASALLDRQEDDPERSFGLYMDERWRPTWPAEIIDWPDFELPTDRTRAAQQIRAAFARAARGEVVEIGCLGGLGRTGTVLACMAVMAGVAPPEAVQWVREHYDPRAVETREQEEWVNWFAATAGAAA
jgi:hypothetical protein